ncbi:MAG TPA: arylesterase [Planctomycetota bacterium]|nr:arylesterase [Planctomycetota bacterium]
MSSRRSFTALLALLATCAACSDRHPAGIPAEMDGAARTASDPAKAPEISIVFLGDSLTAGSGLARDEAYPDLLGERFTREGRAVRIVNAGVSGDTSAGGLARLSWLLAQAPDVLVVALGANDGMRGLPVDAMERNLSEIVARAREAGCRVLLVGMRVPPNYGENYARAFAAVYPRVAEKHDVPLVPFLLEGVGGVPALNQADGVHPTARGQEKMADTVGKSLAELLHEK